MIILSISFCSGHFFLSLSLNYTYIDWFILLHPNLWFVLFTLVSNSKLLRLLWNPALILVCFTVLFFSSSSNRYSSNRLVESKQKWKWNDNKKRPYNTNNCVEAARRKQKKNQELRAGEKKTKWNNFSLHSFISVGRTIQANHLSWNCSEWIRIRKRKWFYRSKEPANCQANARP